MVHLIKTPKSFSFSPPFPPSSPFPRAPLQLCLSPASIISSCPGFVWKPRGLLSGRAGHNGGDGSSGGDTAPPCLPHLSPSTLGMCGWEKLLQLFHFIAGSGAAESCVGGGLLGDGGALGFRELAPPRSQICTLKSSPCQRQRDGDNPCSDGGTCPGFGTGKSTWPCWGMSPVSLGLGSLRMEGTVWGH